MERNIRIEHEIMRVRKRKQRDFFSKGNLDSWAVIIVSLAFIITIGIILGNIQGYIQNKEYYKNYYAKYSTPKNLNAQDTKFYIKYPSQSVDSNSRSVISDGRKYSSNLKEDNLLSAKDFNKELEDLESNNKQNKDEEKKLNLFLIFLKGIPLKFLGLFFY
jgi:hypothetical protein